DTGKTLTRWPVFVDHFTSGMGNDATVELSPVAGRNVLGIRDGIIRDQTALRTLQEYIRTQCLR
ncbi:lysis protein, partial [Escherichia coli]|nr:hypothetical protein [Shigella flexneri]MJK74614.1 hypothetical protein [Shigella flexneri]HAW4394749.1 hypothetical protein [Escherichia coli]